MCACACVRACVCVCVNIMYITCILRIEYSIITRLPPGLARLVEYLSLLIHGGTKKGKAKQKPEVGREEGGRIGRECVYVLCVVYKFWSVRTSL